MLYTLWCNTWLPNKYRDFIFKFTNNMLGLNTRIAHFTDRTDRRCTFCVLTGKAVSPDETFPHLFYDCDSTSQILNKFYTKYFLDLGLGPDSIKLLWFGSVPHTVRDKIFLSLAVLYIQYQVWDSKLGGRVPNFNKINYELIHFLCGLTKLSKNVCTFDNSFILSRDWLLLAGHGIH
jgi:hypothetical protein